MGLLGRRGWRAEVRNRVFGRAPSNGNFKFKYVATAGKPTATASCETVKARLVIRD